MSFKNTIHIPLIAAAVLSIPILGNRFVDGWNWTWHDFLFAWVYFVVFGFAFRFVRQRVTDRTHRIVACLAVIGVFLFVWGMLARG